MIQSQIRFRTASRSLALTSKTVDLSGLPCVYVHFCICIHIYKRQTVRAHGVLPLDACLREAGPCRPRKGPSRLSVPHACGLHSHTCMRAHVHRCEPTALKSLSVCCLPFSRTVCLRSGVLARYTATRPRRLEGQGCEELCRTPFLPKFPESLA